MSLQPVVLGIFRPREDKNVDTAVQWVITHSTGVGWGGVRAWLSREWEGDSVPGTRAFGKARRQRTELLRGVPSTGKI